MATPSLLLFMVALLTYAGFTMSATPCPDCGTTPIPYPLSTGPTCGHQSYKIRCDAGKLLFDTLNNSYPITSIDPSTQRLVIEPANLQPNTCIASDFIHQGVQLNKALPFNITSSNTIMFLNCTDALLRSPLNCSSNSLCHTYINGTQEAAACKGASLCCSFRTGGSTTAYMIRVRESGCSAYTSFANLDPNLPVDQWPHAGLELEWAQPTE